MPEVDLTFWNTYQHLKPHQLNQFIRLIPLPVQPFVEVHESAYEPTVEDSKYLARLNYKSPFFLNPHYVSDTPRDQWLIANYQPVWFHVVPRPGGNYKIVNYRLEGEFHVQSYDDCDLYEFSMAANDYDPVPLPRGRNLHSFYDFDSGLSWVARWVQVHTAAERPPTPPPQGYPGFQEQTLAYEAGGIGTIPARTRFRVASDYYLAEANDCIPDVLMPYAYPPLYAEVPDLKWLAADLFTLSAFYWPFGRNNSTRRPGRFAGTLKEKVDRFNAAVSAALELHRLTEQVPWVLGAFNCPLKWKCRASDKWLNYFIK